MQTYRNQTGEQILFNNCRCVGRGELFPGRPPATHPPLSYIRKKTAAEIFDFRNQKSIPQWYVYGSDLPFWALRGGGAGAYHVIRGGGAKLVRVSALYLLPYQ